MNVAGSQIKSLQADKRKKLFDLQKKYINVETKLMFERDKNTKRDLSNQLKELSKKRWEIINTND